MIPNLNWSRNGDKLFLSGKLDDKLLHSLWNMRNVLMEGVTHIDLSGVSKIDTAGIALLVHLIELCKKNSKVSVTISHIDNNIVSLINLYNLPVDIFPR